MKRIISSLAINLAFASVAFSGQQVPLQLADGVTLDATYYPAAQPGPGLLFLNMCDPSRDQREWSRVASRLNSKGFHVLTFDYRGFGTSGGDRPRNLRSITEAMPYWREHWMSDVQAAYDLLTSQPDVSDTNMGIAGASCGVFLGLEFALDNANIRSLVFLGGPTDAMQRERLTELADVPILLISGDQKGPNETQGTLEWSDDVFQASTNLATQFHKYKTVTHGTLIFEHHPETMDMVVDWFATTVEQR